MNISAVIEIKENNGKVEEGFQRGPRASFLHFSISLKGPQDGILHKCPGVHLSDFFFFSIASPPESNFKQDVEIVCLNVPIVQSGPTQSNMNKHFL